MCVKKVGGKFLFTEYLFTVPLDRKSGGVTSLHVILEVLQSPGLLEHVFSYLQEHGVIGVFRQKVHVASKLEWRRRPVERVGVRTPVADTVRVEMVDRLLVVVGPPGRVTQRPAADHL